ncbi:hypothetical protein [Acinetobacter populi]|uniref:hypothetical protein n=1 Tax=Acinetobacter populi TaxID=1582270 RepID=UPI00148D2677|nr:hypothetical protein [Acinetobacter populi]
MTIHLKSMIDVELVQLHRVSIKHAQLNMEFASSLNKLINELRVGSILAFDGRGIL